MPNAYPLAWPIGWKRTPAASRKRAAFSVGSRSYMAGAARAKALTVADGLERVLAELRRFGIPDYNVSAISSNVPLRRDGYPRSGEPEPEDPGVAVYWRDAGEAQVMAIDRYDRVADNLAAIAASLEALRGIERHGGAQILKRAFAGFVLPAPGQSAHWRDVLGFPPEATVVRTMIDARYRELAPKRHPDRGGSDEAMSALNRAREDALREAGA